MGGMGQLPFGDVLGGGDTIELPSSNGLIKNTGGILSAAVAGTDFNVNSVLTADPRVAGLTAALGTRGTHSGNLYEKIGAGSRDWTRVNAGAYAELSASAAAIELLGFNGDGERLICFGGIFINADAGDRLVVLRPNGLTTNLRSNVNSGVCSTFLYIAEHRASPSPAIVEGYFWAPTGGTRYMKSTYSCYDPAIPFVGASSGEWTETTTNLTSLRFVSSGLFAAGTKCWAYPAPAKTRAT
jgi:hypothetical protein